MILERMFPRFVGFFLRGQTVSQARARKCWMNPQHQCCADGCQALVLVPLGDGLVLRRANSLTAKIAVKVSMMLKGFTASARH